VRRARQQPVDILSALSAVETDWLDEHANAVLALVETIPERGTYTADDLLSLLRSDFRAGETTIRLVLGVSADEFRTAIRDALPDGRWGKQRLLREPDAILGALQRLGIPEQLGALVNTPITWRSILMERLRSGRGSAIKGQKRGRGLEDFVEVLVKSVFGEGRYDTRCRFTGANGTSTEKADFAIPSKEDPSVLIEAKAYGATGSKQTDVLGDVARVVSEKRPDTDFLLVTDGVTWRDRESDLRKLIEMQHRGEITRIYTRAMGAQLQADLVELKRDHGL
jgi:hypothetical protein